MKFIYRIDGSNIPVYNKPRIQLSSRDKTAIFQYTARSLTLSVLSSVTITSASRLKVYMDSAIDDNLIWTGDIDWNSRISDSKSNIIQVTFVPDVVHLKDVPFTATYSMGTFQDVMDDIEASLGSPWTYTGTINLEKIYIIKEDILGDSQEPNPHSSLSIFYPAPFWKKTGEDPYCKFYNDGVGDYLYSKMWGGNFSSGGDDLPAGYGWHSAGDVSTPISGNVGYGIKFSGSDFKDHHTYFIRDGKIWSYGPQELIIYKFDVSYTGSIADVLKDICQFADAYFYVLDNTIHMTQRMDAPVKSITGSIISRKARYTTVDSALDFSVDYGLTETEEDNLASHYEANYPADKVLYDLVIINPSERVMPGDNLSVNGTVEGIVMGVSLEYDRMVVQTDRLGLD